MHHKNNEKYLITCDGWFLAPDGCQYRAAWGNVEILNDHFLGVKTNARSANWFAKVGDDKNHVIIAGCQIHYAVRCNEKPNTDKAIDWDTKNGMQEYSRPCMIYIAE